MASTDVRTVYESDRWLRVVLQNDGTDESTATQKIDKSGTTGPDGSETGTLALWEAAWDVSGFNWVKALWDHSTDDEILTMSGSGAISYESIGGKDDPESSGGTGDIMIQTDGTGSTVAYHVELLFKKKS